jgi:hypothetical protein
MRIMSLIPSNEVRILVELLNFSEFNDKARILDKDKPIKALDYLRRL